MAEAARTIVHHASSSERETIDAIMIATGTKTPKEAMMKLMTMPQAEKTKIISSAVPVGAFEMVKSILAQKPHNTPLAELRGEHCEEYCNGCGAASNEGENFLRCGRCRAVKYCSKECQKRDWVGDGRGGVTNGRKHKDMCEEFMEILDEFDDHPTAGRTLVKDLFASWADQHHPNGAFFLTEFLARRNLLGNDESVGYWAIPNVVGTWHESGPDPSGFYNGNMLLRSNFPSPQDGWTTALRPDEYPIVSKAPTKDLPKEGVSSWKEYLEFREISPSTLAPLLLTNVVSIYYMVHHTLKLTSTIGRTIRVDVLGTEVELNQIPLFGELVHLLPKETDLTLTFISKGTKEICKESRKDQFKESIIETSNDGVVLDVSNDNDTRVRVRLCADHALFQVVPDDAAGDAILALNAELSGYPEWSAAVHKALRLRRPMCITDTSRITARYVELSWLSQALKDPPVSSLEVETILNPFHGIVNRDIAATKAPDIRNGYITTIMANE